MKYAVYGIGHALVDLVYDIDDSLLQSLGVDKGLMTLAEEDQQEALLEKLSDQPLIKKACGGSAANTMVAISQLGGKSFYSCKVAKDDIGEFYHSDLLSNGVDTNLQTQPHSSGITGSCVVMVTPDAQRSMNTYLGATATFSDEQLIHESLKESEYLYIEGYLVTSPSAQKAAIAARNIARQNGTKVSITLSDTNMVNFFREGLLEIIDGQVDFIFCNQEEALKFAQTQDLEEAKSFLKKLSSGFAITLGAEGAVIFDGQTEHQVSSPSVQAKDSNGAGDMFAGAFLYGITHGYDFQKAGTLACHCASTLVTVDGPRMSQKQTLEVKQSLL